MTGRPGLIDGLLAPLGSTRAQRRLRLGVWAQLAVSVVVLMLVGANQPADPHLMDPAAVGAVAAHSRPGRVAEFSQVGFRLISSAQGGTGRHGCALLADTPSRQQRGMMGRRDLAGYNAMIFRFPQDTTAPFYNKDVPIALSIAWFDAAGVFIASGELALCSSACPLLSPGEAFRYAVEVPKGGLGGIGAGHGSVLLVGGAC